MIHTKYYFRSFVIPILAITALASPQHAVAQQRSVQLFVTCYEMDRATGVYRYTDITPVTINETFPSNGTSDVEYLYKYHGIASEEFTTFFNSKRESVDDARCSAYTTLAGAEWWKSARREAYSRFPVSVISDWQPKLGLSLATVQKPVAPAPSAKRDSLIVRSLDEGPAKAVTNPVAKPAPKPVAAAKPAAKPAPKKPLTPCGRKGQRNCRAKPM